MTCTSHSARTAGRWLAIVGAVCLLAASVRAQELQVIELKFRLADEIIPTVQPLLEPGGVLTGMDNVLFVRTSPGNFAQIQQAVAMLDRAPRQLLISVGQGTVTDTDTTGVRGSATLGDGDVQVGINRPPGSESGARVQVDSRSQQANLRNVSSVRALEGTEAYIAIGHSAPVTTTSVTPGWNGPVVQQTTQYQEVSSGFYATVRVSGERVTLDISPQQQRLTSRNRTVETQGAATIVAGRLGEWIPIGAVREESAGSTAGLLVWGTRSARSEYSAWVKVDEIR
jgi:type II secretory pathway component GspD/PulD (secretin)